MLLKDATSFAIELLQGSLSNQNDRSPKTLLEILNNHKYMQNTFLGGMPSDEQQTTI